MIFNWAQINSEHRKIIRSAQTYHFEILKKEEISQKKNWLLFTLDCVLNVLWCCLNLPLDHFWDKHKYENNSQKVEKHISLDNLSFHHIELNLSFKTTRRWCIEKSVKILNPEINSSIGSVFKATPNLRNSLYDPPKRFII